MLFTAKYSLLIYSLDDLSIVESGVLKSPIIIMLLFISPFNSVNISFIYVGALIWTRIYLQFLYPIDEVTPLLLYSVLLCLFYDFWLKVYFVYYKYSHPFSILVIICINIFFPFLHFWPLRVLGANVSLLKAVYIVSWFFVFLIHSVLMCLLGGIVNLHVKTYCCSFVRCFFTIL